MSDAPERGTEPPRSWGGQNAERGTPPRLILIGVRGSGKTSVGRRVAARLGWTFVDTDERIQQRTGRTIREIFATDGEPAFRALESAALVESLATDRCVISAGGGAVIAADNRQRIRATGLCIWLTAPAAELHRRLQQDAATGAQRPPLTAASGVEEIEQVLAARTRLYAETAHHVIDTAGRSIDAVAEHVLALLPAVGPVGSRGC